MEDILASIRKIIADDPSVPAAQAGAPPAAEAKAGKGPVSLDDVLNLADDDVPTQRAAAKDQPAPLPAARSAAAPVATESGVPSWLFPKAPAPLASPVAAPAPAADKSAPKPFFPPAPRETAPTAGSPKAPAATASDLGAFVPGRGDPSNAAAPEKPTSQIRPEPRLADRVNGASEPRPPAQSSSSQGLERPSLALPQSLADRMSGASAGIAPAAANQAAAQAKPATQTAAAPAVREPVKDIVVKPAADVPMTRVVVQAPTVPAPAAAAPAAVPAPSAPAKSAQVAASAPAAPQPASEPTVPRSMEDTVAELLRPMLRQWLDQNMPRVIEKALRNEITQTGVAKPGESKH